MLNHVEYGFSSKHLCIRPRQPMGVRPEEESGYTPEQLEAIAMQNAVDKLEQQVRDALFARSTAHFGEHRILKSAFNRFDKDASGTVDLHEFEKALEYLGTPRLMVYGFLLTSLCLHRSAHARSSLPPFTAC